MVQRQLKLTNCDQQPLFESLSSKLAQLPPHVIAGKNIADLRFRRCFRRVLNAHPSVVTSEQLIHNIENICTNFKTFRAKDQSMVVLLTIVNAFLYSANQPLLQLQHTGKVGRWVVSTQEQLCQQFPQIIKQAPKKLFGDLAQIKIKNYATAWRRMLFENTWVTKSVAIAEHAEQLFQSMCAWTKKRGISNLVVHRIFNVYRYNHELPLLPYLMEQQTSCTQLQKSDITFIEDIKLKTTAKIAEWVQQIISRVRSYFAIGQCCRNTTVTLYRNVIVRFLKYVIYEEEMYSPGSNGKVKLVDFYALVARFMTTTMSITANPRNLARHFIGLSKAIFSTDLFTVEDVDKFNVNELIIHYTQLRRTQIQQNDCSQRSQITITTENMPTTSTAGSIYQTTIDTPKHVNKRQQQERDYFTDEEIAKFEQALDNRNNNRSNLMYRLLLHTGLRATAIARLRVADVWNVELKMPLDFGSTEEKGGKIRSFPIMRDNMLRNAIIVYLDANPQLITYADRSYLFPVSRVPSVLQFEKPINNCAVGRWVRQLALDAGVHGPHVHPHAFRKTVIQRLFESGNAGHFVSKFIGHTNLSTTLRFYFNPSCKDIEKNMNIPWLNAKPDDLCLADLEGLDVVENEVYNVDNDSYSGSGSGSSSSSEDEDEDVTVASSVTTTTHNSSKTALRRHAIVQNFMAVQKLKEAHLKTEMLEALLKQASPDLFDTYQNTIQVAITQERQRAQNVLETNLARALNS